MKKSKSLQPSLVTVVIVSFNTKKETIRCISSVKKSVDFKDSEIEIIVVDNASSDSTADAIKDSFRDVLLIENDSNIGFGRANNQAIEAARSPYILLLNSDAFVQQRTISTLLSKLYSSDAIAVAPKLIDIEGRVERSCGDFPTLLRLAGWILWLDRLPGWRQLFGQYHIMRYSYYLRDQEPDWVTAACVLFRKEDIISIGGFDERIFMYAEELDLFMRLHKRFNKKCYYLSGATATHLRSRSSAFSGISKIAMELKGIEYIYKKHYNHLAGLAHVIIKFGSILKSSIIKYIPGRKQEYEEYKKFLEMAR